MGESVYGEEEDHGVAGAGGTTAVGRDAAAQALNTIIQLHFEKTLEKKRAVDAQKKELQRLFSLFFIFLAVLFAAQCLSPQPRLQCRHCWAPIGLLTLAHLAFYAAVAQTLRCINGFKYQRRCHKLTLSLATDRLKRLRTSSSAASGGGDYFEIRYQEPPESYLAKFKRSWALHFGFLIFTYGFMVATSVAVLCY